MNLSNTAKADTKEGKVRARPDTQKAAKPQTCAKPLAAVIASYKEEKEIVIMCRTLDQLKFVVADYRSLKTMKDELEEEIKALEREIIGYLDSNNKVSERGDDFSVKVSTCERRTLDAKRLEEDLGSLADYQRVSQYRRLYVK